MLAANPAVNPVRGVPAPVTPEGTPTGTPALLLHLCRRHPETGLAPPDDPCALAECNGFNAHFATTSRVAHAHGKRGGRRADDPAAWGALRRQVPGPVGGCFACNGDHCRRGPRGRGERHTASDACLFVLGSRMEADGVDPSRFPKVRNRRERIRARPAALRALAAPGA